MIINILITYVIFGIFVAYCAHKMQPLTRLEAILFFLFSPATWLVVLLVYISNQLWFYKLSKWLNEEIGSNE